MGYFLPIGTQIIDGVEKSKFISGDYINGFHFLGIGFALIVITMLIIGQIKPRDTDFIQEDVKAVDLNSKVFSSQKGGILMGFSKKSAGPKRWSAAALDSLINLDQPYHVPLRMEHRPFFTPDYVASLQKRVEQEVDRLLDGLEAKAAKQEGRVDMVENFNGRILQLIASAKYIETLTVWCLCADSC